MFREFDSSEQNKADYRSNESYTLLSDSNRRMNVKLIKQKIMKTLKFEGASYDTFGEMGIDGTDHDNCANGKPIVFKLSAEENGATEGMFIYGMYANHQMPIETPGCWMVGVQNLEDDQPLPNWNIRIENGSCEYSPTLLVDVPDNYELTLSN